jgi:hypothetical protein
VVQANRSHHGFRLAFFQLHGHHSLFFSFLEDVQYTFLVQFSQIDFCINLNDDFPEEKNKSFHIYLIYKRVCVKINNRKFNSSNTRGAEKAERGRLS